MLEPTLGDKESPVPKEDEPKKKQNEVIKKVFIRHPPFTRLKNVRTFTEWELANYQTDSSLKIQVFWNKMCKTSVRRTKQKES